MLQLCQLTRIQPIQCVHSRRTHVQKQCDTALKNQALVQSPGDVRTLPFQIHHRIDFPWACSSCRQDAINQSFVQNVVHCMLSASLSLLLSSSSPVMHGPLSWQVLLHLPMVSFNFALVSNDTTICDSGLACFCFPHPQRGLACFSTVRQSSCGGAWDPWSVAYQSCALATLL